MKKVHITPKNKGFNDQRSLSEVPLVRVVSLGAVMAALLSSVSPVFASHFSSAGSTVQSVNAGVASAKAGRADHGRDRVANGDRSCGVDQIVSRSSSRLDKKISAEDKNQLSDGYGDYAFESSCGSDVSVNALTSAGTRSLINADVTAKDWFLEENNPVNWSVNTVPVNVTDTGVVSIDPRGDLFPQARCPSKFKDPNSVCIGNQTDVGANSIGGVALGIYSKSPSRIMFGAAQGYDPFTGDISFKKDGAWEASYDPVSVGVEDGSRTRQIAGVAAGRVDTDAANVAQLKALRRWVENEGFMWRLSADGVTFNVQKGGRVSFQGEDNITTFLKGEEGRPPELHFGLADDVLLQSIEIVDGLKIDSDGVDARDKKIAGLAAGKLSEDSTEAVTGAQLYGVKQNVEMLKGTVDVVEGNVTELDGNINKYLGGGARVLEGKAPIYTIQGRELEGVHAAFDGVDSKLTELDNKISNPGNVGDSSLVQQNEGSKLIRIGGQVAGNKVRITNVEGDGRILSGLAAGKLSEDSTEAVTGAQLYKVEQKVESLRSDVNGVDGDVKKLDTNI